MTGSTKTVPTAMLRRHSVRLRQRSREQTIALADSWLARPVHPIVVGPLRGDPPMHDVADGNSRLDGLEMLGVTEVEVFVTADELTNEDIDNIGFVTAFHREGLDCFEQAQLVIRKRTDGVSNKEVARQLSINEGWASKLNALAGCNDEVKEAARLGQIGPNEWHLIGNAQCQSAALREILAGKGRQAVQRANRKPRTDSVQSSRIRCPLPSGHCVQVAGDGINLEAAIESLAEALRLMKAAQSKGLNIKTAMNLWKDVAAN